MGIELLSSLSCSTCCTCFRRLTKWLLNMSWASADKREAHLLLKISENVENREEPNILFTVRDIPLHLVQRDFAFNLFVVCRAVHVNVHDMLRYRLRRTISNSVWELFRKHTPYPAVRRGYPWQWRSCRIWRESSSGNQCSIKGATVSVGHKKTVTVARQYLSWTSSFVISTKYRIGGCENTGSRVEHSGDSGFRNGNRLLFHSLVDSHSIFVSHLIELIYAHYTSVSEYHRTPF